MAGSFKRRFLIVVLFSACGRFLWFGFLLPDGVVTLSFPSADSDILVDLFLVQAANN